MTRVVFLYLCICICIFVFSYLYFCICIFVFVFVYLHLCYRTFSALTRRTVARMAPRKTLKVIELAPQASALSMSPTASAMHFFPSSLRRIFNHSTPFLRMHFFTSFVLPSYEQSRCHFSANLFDNSSRLNPLTCTKL